MAEKLHQELCFLMSAHTPVQRAIGALLNRMWQDNRLQALGYSRRSDFLSERLGMSVREAQELAWVERTIVDYPTTEEFWMRGELNRSKVRLILRGVRPEDDTLWACWARRLTVRELELKLLAPEDSPLEYREFELTADDRNRLEEALELTERLCAENLSTADALECLSAELQAGAPDDIYRQARDEDDRPTREWRREQARRRAELEAAAERPRKSRPVAVPAVVPDFHVSAEADSVTLDRVLREACLFLQELNATLVRKLWLAEKLAVYRNRGFFSHVRYCVEALGLSAGRVHALRRLCGRLHAVPVVLEAYATGTLSQSQAELVGEVVTVPTAETWVAYANKTTVRKLRKVVRDVRALREEDAAKYRDVLPPALSMETSPQGHALLEEALACMPPMEPKSVPACAPNYPTVPDDPKPLPFTKPGRVRIGLPSDVWDAVGLSLRMASINLGGRPTQGECLSFMVDAFLETYEQEARRAARKRPIAERDLWRCGVPGCSRRGSVEDHHIIFSSHGGSNDRKNRVLVCAFHHHRCIHEGRIVAQGEAPGGIVWVMIGPDDLPDRVFVGDTLVAKR
ncbi:MAG TPA: HNH endonuclease signature motif containing protein [Candidatus Xenobia bacterium]